MYKNFVLIAVFFMLVHTAMSQQAGFSKNDTSIKIAKDSGFDERSMQRIFSRKGFSNKPSSKEDIKKAIYVYNGKTINQSEIDSITSKWETVEIEYDFSKSPIEKNIIKSTKAKYDSVLKLKSGKFKEAFSKKWVLGARLPELSFADINGIQYNNNQLEGKIVVINFWFVGCAPCRREMPELNELVTKYKGRNDVVFLAIGLDTKEEQIGFTKLNKFMYNLVDDAERKITALFNVAAWPSHLIFDKNGENVFSHEGYDVNLVKKIDYYISSEIRK